MPGSLISEVTRLIPKREWQMPAFCVDRRMSSARVEEPLPGRGAGSKAFLGQSRVVRLLIRVLLIGFSPPFDGITFVAATFTNFLSASALWSPRGASLIE